MLDIIDIDFKNPDHGAAVVALLDEYASGDMGGEEPLSAFTRGNLAASLAARPWAQLGGTHTASGLARTASSSWLKFIGRLLPAANKVCPS